MERINVSEAWRMHQCDTTFELRFAENVDMNKAFEAMKAAVEEINYENGYADIWLQDLGDCCDKDHFEILSKLWTEEFEMYIPAMCKAVAAAFPNVSFNGYACYDSLKCYCVDDYEFSFNGSCLHIEETFADDECGYFCPDCGYQVAFYNEEFDSDEIECDDCKETIKVADLKYVPPFHEVKDIIIK